MSLINKKRTTLKTHANEKLKLRVEKLKLIVEN